MVFSSTLFLFLFLPVVLFLYLIAGRRLRNVVLLIASLFFYVWGENVYVLVLLSSILINYVVGLYIERSISRGSLGKKPLTVGIVANVSLLVFFKYANFLVENINLGLEYFGVSAIELSEVHLPIGISFFTFQAISYIVDIYRQESRAQTNPINIGLYISLFPQLIAGPIVRYNSISEQISKRRTSLHDFAQGTERFIFGLGKKVLIANPLGEMADVIFLIPASDLSTSAAWLGMICYSLQIYFDFSGYSDMAIGIGRLFGFRFPENFNYPYISRSIRDFWRRWHISLSSWFRDYVYIPLGGNRLGGLRTSSNLLLVFLLCGLWHGASWNFLIWGLLHGIFLIAERGALGKLLYRIPVITQTIYALFVILNTWVFFRLDDLPSALDFLYVMYGGASTQSLYPYIIQGMDTLFVITLLAAIVLSTPIYPFIKDRFNKAVEKNITSSLVVTTAFSLKAAIVSSIFILSLSAIAVGSYNPFIYFRF